jgi:hypothetical protein
MTFQSSRIVREAGVVICGDGVTERLEASASGAGSGLARTVTGRGDAAAWGTIAAGGTGVAIEAAGSASDAVDGADAFTRAAEVGPSGGSVGGADALTHSDEVRPFCDAVDAAEALGPSGGGVDGAEALTRGAEAVLPGLLVTGLRFCATTPLGLTAGPAAGGGAA